MIYIPVFVEVLTVRVSTYCLKNYYIEKIAAEQLESGAWRKGLAVILAPELLAPHPISARPVVRL
jgi:hypothetical protein